jgi:hypothetical protein
VFSSYSPTNTNFDATVNADFSTSTPAFNFVGSVTGGGSSFGDIAATSFTWFDPATGVNGGTTSGAPFTTAYLPIGELTLVVTAPVPEPGSLSLLAIGVGAAAAGLARRGRWVGGTLVRPPPPSSAWRLDLRRFRG